MKNKILIVDDDLDFRSVISEALQGHFEVDTTNDIDFVYDAALDNKYDLLLLDINLGLPTTGLDLCRKIRKQASAQRIPIVILTGQGKKDIQITSYDVGADDYFDKMEDIDVIVASLQAKIKRMQDIAGKKNIVGNLILHSERYELEINGITYKLNSTELSILNLFINNVNRPISRDEIKSLVWKDLVIDSRVVDVHISNLRKKITNFDHEIESLYGKGYILRPIKNV